MMESKLSDMIKLNLTFYIAVSSHTQEKVYYYSENQLTALYVIDNTAKLRVK